MISPDLFLDELRKKGIIFFCGVPDSLLKNLCACIDSLVNKESHIITANEGNAAALAAGYYLSTSKIAAVYLQNSGIGNLVNPLVSLTDPEVYKIPILLIIGWRGEPGIKDEPQHSKQGRITPALLETLEIPYETLSPDSDYKKIIKNILKMIETTSAPAAILVRKGTFFDYKPIKQKAEKRELTREEALGVILDLSKENEIFVSTTGKTSRELYELRAARGEKQKDFFTVGSMGHTSSIALGIALGRPEKHVVCLDGDGSMLMHMGSLPVIGDSKPRNLIHVILNNEAHESVGGQRTVAGNIDLKNLFYACGYTKCISVDNQGALKEAWEEINNIEGPVMIEIKIRQGSRSNLGRPLETPEDNKKQFMEHINAL